LIYFYSFTNIFKSNILHYFHSFKYYVSNALSKIFSLLVSNYNRLNLLPVRFRPLLAVLPLGQPLILTDPTYNIQDSLSFDDNIHIINIIDTKKYS